MNLKRFKRRSTVRSAGAGTVVTVLAALALVAAGCAEDDPIVVAAGVAICELDRPAIDTEASSGDIEAAEGVARIVFADEGHDDDEIPHEEEDGEAPHDDDEAPHDDDVPHEEEAAVVDWVVDMEMDEFSYRCQLPAIQAGSTIAMNLTNVGFVEHEAVIGDLPAQLDAEAEMAAGVDPDGHAHDRPSIVLGPGESGTLVVTLEQPGDLIIGCHIPGHWDAGMRADFTVV